VKELEVTIDEEWAKGSALQLGGDLLRRKYSLRTVGFATLTVIWFAMAVQLAHCRSASTLSSAIEGG